MSQSGVLSREGWNDVKTVRETGEVGSFTAGFSDEAIKWNEVFLDRLRPSRTVRSC